jgi:twinkle protein
MNAEEVKASLAESAEHFARWLFPAGRKNGSNWQVGSLAGETGKSLAICVAGSKVGVFKDFATDESGDNLVELFAQARQVEFKDALRACADWLGVPLSAHADLSAPPPILSRPTPLPTPMTDSDCERALAMAATLRNDLALCERIARSRNWRQETIVDLAHEPSLGWDAGKLAFLYESGVKLRWRENGERIILWAFGRPWLWRGGFLWGRSTIYICEGETDAISLIDAGIESDETTLVVAIPSATTFNEEWAGLFKGKNVILALDGDKAGIDATAKIAGLLRPVVSSLGQVNWGGIEHAS